MRPPVESKRVVYVIQLQEPSGPGPIKIGSTCDLKRRLREIRHENAYPVETLRVRFSEDGRLERILLRELAGWRLRGEWHRPECLPRLRALLGEPVDNEEPEPEPEPEPLPLDEQRARAAALRIRLETRGRA